MPDSKEKILKTINRAEEGDLLSRRFDQFIMWLIFLNVAAVIIETVQPIYEKYHLFFDTFEFISVIIFSVEYIIRVWACTAIEKYRHPVWGRLKYMISLGAIIDLLAILPFYLPLILASTDGRILRILRLFRLFRIFKLGRYSLAFNLISVVIKKRRAELTVSLTLLVMLLIFASTLMFYVESESNPDGFQSIPETMWWGVATLTTVGYGDVYPITPLGKFLAGIIAILGVGLFALPAGIIASGFESELSNQKKDKEEDEDA